MHTYICTHAYIYMPWYIVWRTSYNWNSSLFNYILMTFSKGNGLIISNFNNFAFIIKLHKTMVYTTIKLNGANLIAHSMTISSFNRFTFCYFIYWAIFQSVSTESEGWSRQLFYGIKMSYFIEINRNLKKPIIHSEFYITITCWRLTKIVKTFPSYSS